ncbi:hypothetical protein IWW38_006506, partial [Coemansia aciculifera]
MRDSHAKSDAAVKARSSIIVDSGVLGMAHPKDESTKRVADATAHNIVLILEDLLSPGVVPLKQNLADIRNRLRGMVAGFADWVLPENQEAGPEKTIYPEFGRFVLFVMACLKALDLEAPLGSQFRLLLPATINDFVPGGSSEGYRLDSVLTLYPWATTVDAIIAMYKDADSDKSKGTDADNPRKKNKTRPQYAEIFAVVEAKVAYKPTTGKESTHPTLLKAQGQLVLYNRQVYEHQHGRLFTWGMTVCGSLVRAYHFGPDIILDSGDLDVTESAGRRMLVEWL